ncbi:hypothetical protein E2C01_044705 [Portunus trituberculatus]|uniref:Uncharacterized protein n=1 Tax=Portunus trituberculatus TaxID=210409 RepID=A0A5B7FWA8_PORTR|nr:hypothetical protein [Portunus trituberculatus]
MKSSGSHPCRHACLSAWRWPLSAARHPCAEVTHNQPGRRQGSKERENREPWANKRNERITSSASHLERREGLVEGTGLGAGRSASGKGRIGSPGRAAADVE